MTTSLANSPNELWSICELPTGSALPRAARFLADLVKELWPSWDHRSYPCSEKRGTPRRLVLGPPLRRP